MYEPACPDTPSGVNAGCGFGRRARHRATAHVESQVFKVRTSRSILSILSDLGHAMQVVPRLPAWRARARSERARFLGSRLFPLLPGSLERADWCPGGMD